MEKNIPLPKIKITNEEAAKQYPMQYGNFFRILRSKKNNFSTIKSKQVKWFLIAGSVNSNSLYYSSFDERDYMMDLIRNNILITLIGECNLRNSSLVLRTKPFVYIGEFAKKILQPSNKLVIMTVSGTHDSLPPCIVAHFYDHIDSRILSS